MKINLIIFDFDGTLGDTRNIIVQTLQSTMRQMQLPVVPEKECASTIGIPLRAAFVQLCAGITHATADACVDCYRQLFEDNRETFQPTLFPNVLPTLEKLHEKGIKMSIASSRSSLSLKDLLKSMHIDQYFDYIIGADEVKHAKPHPEPVLKTLEDLGFDARETLVVGDMPVDIKMGLGAHTHTCAVSYGNATATQLKESGAHYVVNDFAEILPIIDNYKF